MHKKHRVTWTLFQNDCEFCLRFLRPSQQEGISPLVATNTQHTHTHTHSHALARLPPTPSLLPFRAAIGVTLSQFNQLVDTLSTFACASEASSLLLSYPGPEGELQLE